MRQRYQGQLEFAIFGTQMSKQVTIQGRTFGVFLNETEIDQAIQKIADRLNKDFEGKCPVFISVLNGAFMFTADLLKKITIPCELTFVKLSSYSGTGTTGNVKHLVGLSEDISGRPVIILEDIVDTGLTMRAMLNQVNGLTPASVSIASLLVKPECLKEEITVDYVCFNIPDKFVVGYGLDLDGLGRNLADIYQLIS
jgi:hypoxanthine phosphoribosyltransferase